MRATLGRLFCFCMLGALAPSFAAAASVPDGATIRVNAFTFPQAAYTGAEEESLQLSAEFRNELVSALQQAGLVPAVPSRVKDEEAEAAPEKQEKAEPAKTPKKERSAEETIADEEADLFTDKYTDEEDGIIDDGAAEKDELMAVVEAAERAEKAQEDNDPDQEEGGAEKPGIKPSGKSGAYVITGTVTQYEEQVGAPVSTGRTKRSRAEVTLICIYQVKNPAGKVIISDKTSASSSRIVAETVDIHVALQNLKKKAFFDASHNIAERVSGKTRVRAKDDAEPGSEDDEYADSPGKRLKSGSKSKQRMKWTIN
ncbi:hypothetical protein NB640_01320 [Oxalobacter vibrioformis]|uniref:Uncharacterized protein n=1 Tax=Oxalobacter vibrioformis TaxID=933080 RepID=A0A9E9P2W1_9BURK|nr:hypothetical protein [Oxalobacter vibrioformis]WAW10334.1 hypothetical protein NB640_01320 [Oxalobacter vibrioformis]